MMLVAENVSRNAKCFGGLDRSLQRTCTRTLPPGLWVMDDIDCATGRHRPTRQRVRDGRA